MAGADFAPTPGGLLVPTRPRVSFKAAARNEDDGKKVTKSYELETEREAWFYREAMPEVGTMVRGSANLISQVFLYVGYTDSDGRERPVRDEKGNLAAGFDERLVKAAEGALARYTDLTGSRRELLFAQSESYDVAGGGYFVGWTVDANGDPVEPDDPTKVAGEEFRFVAAAALTEASAASGPGDQKRYELHETPTSKILLPVKHVRRRMYAPDTRWSGRGFGWVQNSLDACRDLYFMTLANRVAAKSGIPADLWLVPLEASPKELTAEGWGPGADGALDGDMNAEGTWAAKIEQLMGQFVMEALEDQRSGKTVIPAFLAVEAQFIEKFKNLSLRRGLDKELAGAIAAARTRIAESADAPVELMRGLGGSNRWNGITIQLDEYRRYFRPKVQSICGAWTTGLLWPELVATGFKNPADYSRLQVLANPRAVLSEPDQTGLAATALRLGAIGWRGYRSMTGIPEDLAPTPAELQELIDSGVLGANPQGDHTASGTGRGDQGPPSSSPSSPDMTKGSAAPVALGTVEGLGGSLLDIELEAEARLEEACEAALDAAVGRVNARLRNWGKAVQTSVPAPLATCDLEEVHTLLGPERIRVILESRQAQGDPSIEDLVAVAVAALLVKYERIVKAAYVKVERALGREVNAADRDAAIERGKAALRTGMLLLAEAELYGRNRDGGPGEKVAGIRVPLSLIRLALAVAGGALIASATLRPTIDYSGGRGHSADGTVVAGGLAFGPLLSRLAPPADDREWVYGLEPRMQPFEPHEMLDGKIVTGPDDPQLSGSIFTSVSPQWFPGDHGGCRCHWVPIYKEVPR